MSKKKGSCHFHEKSNALERLDKRKSYRIRYGWDIINKWSWGDYKNLWSFCGPAAPPGYATLNISKLKS